MDRQRARSEGQRPQVTIRNSEHGKVIPILSLQHILKALDILDLQLPVEYA